MIRRLLLLLVGCAGLGAGRAAVGQTHKVAKPETVVRAVGVYEWTGDLAKPASSRLVPVTVFIDGQLQDAGVYLARPVPFALLTGNLYELQTAGVTRGALELSFARHLQLTDTATGATAYDDGWFGYGSFKAPAAPKKTLALRASTQLSQVKSSGGKGSGDDGRPHFSNKGGAADKDSETPAAGSGKADSGKADSAKADAPVGSATPADADRPTMRRRSGSSDGGSGGGSGGATAGKTSSGSGSGSSAATDTSTPADDPDRPHLSKRPAASADGDSTAQDGAAGAGQGGTGGDSAGATQSAPTTASGGSKDDPDRPTLKRRSAEEIQKDRKREDRSTVTGVGSLNDDPNRPVMHRGKPASAMTEDDLPKMKGLPVDLKQMVAVSDAANRPVHDFARPWDDDAERKAILTKMEMLARARLAAYGVKTADAAAGSAAVKPAASKAPMTAARRAAARKAAAPAPEVALLDEELKGYTLSYGGLATYVFSAHTAGAGAALDYVTVVAQADAMGELKVALENVTDAAHLDRTPRMRLVDAVDAEASNRASLLFELRGQGSRQFGLYSVIGARAEQKFLSGTTQ